MDALDSTPWQGRIVLSHNRTRACLPVLLEPIPAPQTS
jgi:hypothetical protein